MGYGHLRPAYALANMLCAPVLRADQPPLAGPDEQRHWAQIRRYYETISRASQWSVVGRPFGMLLNAATDIRDLYAARDQSRPTVATRLLDTMIGRGFGATLVDYLSRHDATLLTTFFAPAIAADRLGYDRVFCVVTDNDVNRLWAPRDASSTNITYLVPTHWTRRRLRAYGVPEARIRVTGFPLPHELVGGADRPALCSHVSKRLVRLDPTGTFRAELKHAIFHFLGELPELAAEEAIPRLTYAVGGAGAQVGLVRRWLPSLRSLLDEGRLKVTLVAGVRREVADELQQAVAAAGLRELCCSRGAVEILVEPTIEQYLQSFNALLADTDLLWTKPSELTFFAGLGIALLFAPDVGVHERCNRRWAREQGFGLKQRDPRYAGQWLQDWLNDGTLASAAWNGFTRAPTFGLYQILEAVGASGAAARGVQVPAPAG
jgi:hypothetical protein